MPLAQQVVQEEVNAAKFASPPEPASSVLDNSTSQPAIEATSSSACSSSTPDVEPPSSSAPPSSAPSVISSARSYPKDHNSVTIKSDTKVKDAAGAVVKVLNRLNSMFVTALRLDVTHESLNRAVKSIAVARKYIQDQGKGEEMTFLPFNRSNGEGNLDPNLFAFLVFKTVLGERDTLLDTDQTDLNVSRSSDPNAMANAIIRVVKERGQAVMKAGGADAIFVAMTAVINARRRLKRNHNSDIMLVPAWITEDTVSSLGRESKFLRFNILSCPTNGPLDRTVHPNISSSPAV